MDKLKNNLLKFTDAFQSNNYIKSITTAMMALMPIMMISSLASLINAVTVWGVKDILTSIGVTQILTLINAMTIDLVSVYVAFLVAYKFGEAVKGDSLNSAIMGLLAFFILTPLTVSEGFKGFNLSALGSTGMFVAMIGGLLGARIYNFFVDRNWTIKMPDSVPPVVSKSFAAIIPGVMVAAIVGILAAGFSMTSFGSLSALVYAIVQKPLTVLGANIFAVMIIVAFIELLWFFGMHGVLAVYPILMLVFYEPQLANLAAYSAGEALPYLFTMGFILNNRGARSFAVSLLAIFNSKSQHMKAVGKLGIIPSIFGISEPIKFGIPQVMNIRMLIPLMLTPAVSVFIAWILTVSGFMGYHNGVALPTGFPIIFGGFLTNGWQGIVAQILQLVACVIIYIPFINAQDKEYLSEELNNNQTEVV